MNESKKIIVGNISQYIPLHITLYLNFLVHFFGFYSSFLYSIITDIQNLKQTEEDYLFSAFPGKHSTKIVHCVSVSNHHTMHDFGSFLISSLCRSGGSFQPGLALIGNSGQQLLDLGDGSAGVQSLGASLGTVHNGMTPGKKKKGRYKSSVSLI